MNEDTVVTQPLANETRQPKEPRHIGIIRMTDGLVDAAPMFAELLRLDATTIQSELRDHGVFARLHKALLLPESYQVVAIFHEGLMRQWKVYVESAIIPLANEATNYPDVSPIYQRSDTGEIRLTDIRIDVRMHGLTIDEMLRML